MSVHIQMLENVRLRSMTDSRFPSSFSAWVDQDLECPEGNTHFGFVHRGSVELRCGSGVFRLGAGMYFCVPGAFHLSGLGSAGCVSTRHNWMGLFQVGGPIENKGRLRYIDGCSDTLLISPVVLGDPCLNLLVIPPGTAQTEHTHPSCRSGMIVSGSGVCRTPNVDFPLHAGMTFEIAPDGLHSFHTTDESLRVIAWHPDSDCGPQHDDHPMINRTMIEGRSAAELARSRTDDMASLG